MDENEDLINYDETEAVKFIQNFLPQEMKDKYTEDQINYIIDIVYDFYEEKGFFEDSREDSELINIDEDEIVNFVLKATEKDKLAKFTYDDISLIIQGELAYCDSIGIFEE